MLSPALCFAVVFGYLLGSVSSAVIICKIMGLPDPRQAGSKNPGATNVLRIGGKKAAAATLLFDVLKGVFPVLLAKLYGLAPLGVALTALAAFLGHLYPIFFRFEGGKGVATLIGGLAVISFPTAGCFVLTWIILALIFRYSSLSSIVSAILVPVYAGYFTGNATYALIIAIMSLILIFRHRSNIKRLLLRQETKIGEKRISSHS